MHPGSSLRSFPSVFTTVLAHADQREVVEIDLERVLLLNKRGQWFDGSNINPDDRAALAAYQVDMRTFETDELVDASGITRLDGHDYIEIFEQIQCAVYGGFIDRLADPLNTLVHMVGGCRSVQLMQHRKDNLALRRNSKTPFS